MFKDGADKHANIYCHDCTNIEADAFNKKICYLKWLDHNVIFFITWHIFIISLWLGLTGSRNQIGSTEKQLFFDKTKPVGVS